MATITSTTTGNWTDGTTWVGGIAPAAGDTVVVANTHTVTMNVNSTDVYGAITINTGGTLTWATSTDTELHFIGQLTNNGTVNIGTSSTPITANAEIYFGGNATNYDIKNNSDSCVFTCYGSTAQRITTLNGAVSATDTTITVTSATDMAIGDVLFLPGTSAYNQMEEVEISGISGNDITITSGLSYAHADGCAVLQPESGNVFFKPHSTTYWGRIYHDKGSFAMENANLYDIAQGSGYAQNWNVYYGNWAGNFYMKNVSIYAHQTATRSTGALYLTGAPNNNGGAPRYNGDSWYDLELKSTPDIENVYSVCRDGIFAGQPSYMYIKGCFSAPRYTMGYGSSAMGGTSRYHSIYENCTFVNSYGTFSINGGVWCDLKFINCDFGRYGTVVHPDNTFSFFNQTCIFHDVTFTDCYIYGFNPTSTTGGTVAPPDAFHFDNLTTNSGSWDFVTWHSSSGYIERDSATYHGTSGYGIKMNPTSSHMLYFKIPVLVKSTSTSISVWGKKSATGWTNHPYCRLVGLNRSDIDSTVTWTDVSTSWVEKTFSISPASDQVLFLYFAVPSDSSRYFHFSDITVS